MKDSSEEASCSRCGNRTDGNPPFCTWMNAEISVGLSDDPECEGFQHASDSNTHEPRGLRTRLEKGYSNKIKSVEGNSKRISDQETPVDEFSITACPKTLDKSLIQTALKFKGFKGSVVMEKISCGKPGCHCQNGALHGPYSYLHYYSNGKVKRRYLNKTMSALLSHSAEELERMLHETEAVLGQEQREASHN